LDGGTKEHVYASKAQSVSLAQQETAAKFNPSSLIQLYRVIPVVRGEFGFTPENRYTSGHRDWLIPRQRQENRHKRTSAICRYEVYGQHLQRILTRRNGRLRTPVWDGRSLGCIREPLRPNERSRATAPGSKTAVRRSTCPFCPTDPQVIAPNRFLRRLFRWTIGGSDPCCLGPGRILKQ
jgi:hypothetical protein